MRIVVTANGTNLDAPTSPIFGRCPVFVFVDTETMAFEPVENPALDSAHGAGIQAAQFIVEQGAQALVTGQVGPNAYDVLQAAGVGVYTFREGTVRQAVQAVREARLQVAGGATGPQHAGTFAGRGAAMPAPAQSDAASRRAERIAELQARAGELRRQLAQILEEIDQLDKTR